MKYVFRPVFYLLKFLRFFLFLQGSCFSVREPFVLLVFLKGALQITWWFNRVFLHFLRLLVFITLSRSHKKSAHKETWKNGIPQRNNFVSLYLLGSQVAVGDTLGAIDRWDTSLYRRTRWHSKRCIPRPTRDYTAGRRNQNTCPSASARPRWVMTAAWARFNRNEIWMFAQNNLYKFQHRSWIN